MVIFHSYGTVYQRVVITIVDIPSIGITQLSMFDALIVGSSRLGSGENVPEKLFHVIFQLISGQKPCSLMILWLLSNIIQDLWKLSESTGKSVATRQEVNEGCVEEWSAQLGEALELLRSLRPQGAKVNVSCQMGPVVLDGPGWMGIIFGEPAVRWDLENMKDLIDLKWPLSRKQTDVRPLA
jgi:hypothetical protein